MKAEKIFWAFLVVASLGMTLFFAYGILNPELSGSGKLPGSGLAEANYVPLESQVNAAQEQASSAPNGSAQDVTLTLQGSNYYPYPIRAKVGQTVRITADLSSVRGCATTIIMPEFGVQKTFTAGDDTIEFTPTKSGTYAFSCGMGMYIGQIVVENADGSVADYAGSAPVKTGGSCGMSRGGGCGCGR
jgi:plastocyanin